MLLYEAQCMQHDIHQPIFRPMKAGGYDYDALLCILGGVYSDKFNGPMVASNRCSSALHAYTGCRGEGPGRHVWQRMLSEATERSKAQGHLQDRQLAAACVQGWRSALLQACAIAR